MVWRVFRDQELCHRRLFPAQEWDIPAPHKQLSLTGYKNCLVLTEVVQVTLQIFKKLFLPCILSF